jgi:hypothetical protein
MSDDPHASADAANLDDADALLSRLRVIEDQPLQERATAFIQVHDELRRGLEGSDVSA